METREASIPTERSIPPEIMTIVMPTATIPGYADLLQDVQQVHRADEGRKPVSARHYQLQKNDND